MPDLPERARTYLEALEADRLAALAVSQQKAEEAKLIKARQEGFQAALGMLCSEISVAHAAAPPKEPECRRRGCRPIPQLILRELSFSAQPMTAAQIARAIDYIRERTETALKRMEKGGQLLRDNEGRWTIGITAPTHINEHAARPGNGKSPL